MVDILDAIAIASASLRSAGIEIEALRLKSHKQGLRFIALVDQKPTQLQLGDPKLGKYTEVPPVMQTEILGIKVEWPAEQFKCAKTGKLIYS